MNEKRLKILLITPGIHPKMIGRPSADWCFAKALQSHADVHIAMDERFKTEALAGGFDAQHLTCVDRKNSQGRAIKIARYLSGLDGRTSAAYSGLYHAAYPGFERKLISILGKRIAEGEFDAVHRIGPLTSLVGSPLAGFCARRNVPFIWGPLVDELPWPKGFEEYSQWRDWPLWERVISFLTGSKAALSNAAQLVAGSRAELEKLTKWAQKSAYIPADAFDSHALPFRPITPVVDVPRLIYHGRLEEHKGAMLLLEAAALPLREHKLTFDIIGEGPLKPAMMEFVKREQLQSQVRFLGWVPTERLNAVIHEGHIFGFPALREVRGVRLIEAMALGLVPLGLHYGAAEEYISSSTGMSVLADSKSQLVRGLRRTLYEVTENPAQLQRLRQAAQIYAYEQCTWEVRARQYLELYQKNARS